MDNEEKDKKEFDLNIITPYIEEFLEKYEIKRIHADFMERIILLVIAGLGLITALAWDDFFKVLFTQIFSSANSMENEFIYAVFLTLFTAGFTVLLSRIFRKRKK